MSSEEQVANAPLHVADGFQTSVPSLERMACTFFVTTHPGTGAMDLVRHNLNALKRLLTSGFQRLHSVMTRWTNPLSTSLMLGTLTWFSLKRSYVGSGRGLAGCGSASQR
jgi:hypothetical protein